MKALNRLHVTDDQLRIFGNENDNFQDPKPNLKLKKKINSWRKTVIDFFSASRIDTLPIMDQRAHLRDTDNVKTALDALENHIKNEISLITRRDRLAQHLVVTVSNRDLQADLLKMPTHTLLKIRTKCMQWENAAANQKALDERKNTILQHRARSQLRSKAFSEQGPRAGNDGCCIWCGSHKLHPHVNCQPFGKKCHRCQGRGHLSHRCLVSKGAPHNEKNPEKYSNQSQFQRKGRTNAIRTKVLAIRVQIYCVALVSQSMEPYQLRKLLFPANGDEMRCHETVESTVRFRDLITTTTAYPSPKVDGILVSWHTLKDLRIIGRFFPLNDRDALEEGLIEPLSCSQAIQKGLVVADKAAEVRQIKPAKCVTFSETDSLQNLLDSLPLDPTPRDVELVMTSLLEKYHDVFDTSSLRSMLGKPMHIYLRPVPPGDQLQQRTTAVKVPIHCNDLAKAEIDRMLSEGIIRPMIGPSKWLSSFLVVAKPGVGVRLVVNFKELNKMNLPTALWTDASHIIGFGFALMQNHGKPNQEHWRLITCGSRFLTSTESRYAALEAELQAIV
ncbi:hypothetical protein TCAL_06564, partial [Tigriopus californicus]|eukprot:TCALIF_06564-PA protein Name:"Protein of unknown function" AED:0.15 eAED:0.23 QI:7/0/0/1/0/0/6/0/558